MKKLLIASSIAACLAAPVQADTILGLYIGGQVWDSAASGVFGEIDNQTDFNLKDETQTGFHVALEHPVPLIPNIKIASTSLDTTGQTTLNLDFSFNGEDFTSGDSVDATFDVSYVDYTLYYEILDNDLITLDIGLTARDIDGDISVASTGGVNALTATESVSAVIPMLYASAIVGLPLTGLNVFAEGNVISYDDHTIYDYQAGISYDVLDNMAVDLNIAIGYRAVGLELEDLDDVYADLDFKGVFIASTIHF